MSRITIALVAWAVATAAGSFCAWLLLDALTVNIVLVSAAASLMLLPPAYDPAIQIKDRQMRRQRKESGHAE